MDIEQYVLNDDYVGLAEYYYNNKLYSAALTYYMRILEKEPNYEHLIRVTSIYYILGNREHSVELMAKYAKVLNPEYADSYYFQAMAAFNLKNYFNLYEISGIGKEKLNCYVDNAQETLKVLYVYSLFRLDLTSELNEYLESTSFIYDDFINSLLFEIFNTF